MSVAKRSFSRYPLPDLEAQMRQVAEHIPVAFAMFDTQMRYLLANKRWLTAYGLGERDIIGQSHYDIFPEIGEDWKDIHRRCLAGEINVAEEAPFPRADGRLDWIKWDVRPWYTASGEVGGLLMYTDVITDRVNNRREVEAQARLFSRGSAVVFRWRAAEGLPVEYASRSLAQFGYTPEELVSGSVPYTTLVHPDDLAHFSQQIAYYSAQGVDNFNQEYRIISKDGNIHWVYALIQIMRDEQGQITDYYGYILDISQLRQQEEARRIVEARYASLVANNDDYVTVVDSEGKVQFVNHADSSTEAEVYGRPLTSLVPPEQVKTVTEGLHHVISTGQTLTYNLPGRRRSGEIGFFAARMMPIKHGSDVVGATIIATDITELDEARKEREKLIAELRVANRLAQENARLKSEFLSTMSHELRTPLNAIEGFTSIMLSNMGVELTPRARGMIERISTNSKRLMSLINDFLDLSRIESGRMELVSSPIQPRSLAESWHRQIGILAESKGLNFKLEVDENLPTLLGDEEALSKIGINLLSNAVKFTHQGQVTLRMRRAAHDLWHIEVEDTGIGIPLHAREYIFDEFRQVDQSSKRLYGGTGLGLAIVQKLTRLMGGTVSVQSEVGRGSIFTVALPLTCAAGN